MKNILLMQLLILFTLNLTAVQAQSGSVIYKVSTNSEINAEAQKDAKEFLNRSDSYLKEIEFLLQFNGTESSFRLVEKVQSEADAFFYKTAVATTGALHKEWYVNLREDLILQHYEFMGSPFLISSRVSDLNWRTYNETKKIGGFKTYRATGSITRLGSQGPGTREVEVWFAPELSPSFGPMELAGLPGLILELNYGRITFSASEINLGPAEEVEINRPTKGKRMTSEAFFDTTTESIQEYREAISN